MPRTSYVDHTPISHGNGSNDYPDPRPRAEVISTIMSSVPAQQHQWYVGTYFPTEKEHKHWQDTGELPLIPFDPTINNNITDYMGQWEEEPGKRLHIQFCVRFATRYANSTSAIKALKSSRHIQYLEPMRIQGNAQRYVLKPETRVAPIWDHWVTNNPGVNRRTHEEKKEVYAPTGIKNQNSLLADIKAGMSKNDCISKYTEIYIRQSQAFVRMFCQFTPPRGHNFEPRVIILWGEPGAGKSYWYRKNFPDCFVKDAGSKYWDGYNGEKVVVVDDFVPDNVDGNVDKGRGFKEFRLNEWNGFINKGPRFIEVKFGQDQLKAETWIFTSNVDPTRWWTGDPLAIAFHRRIDQIGHFKTAYMGKEPDIQWSNGIGISMTQAFINQQQRKFLRKRYKRDDEDEEVDPVDGHVIYSSISVDEPEQEVQESQLVVDEFEPSLSSNLLPVEVTSPAYDLGEL